MRLRLRIGLVVAAATVPFLAVLTTLDLLQKRAAAERELAELTLLRTESYRAQEQCEADPEAWRRSGRRPPPRNGGPNDATPPQGPPPQGPREREPPPRSGIRPGPEASPGYDRPPLRGPGRRRPAEFYPLAEDLTATSAEAPAVDRSIAEGLETAEWTALEASWIRSDVLVLVRTPWGVGPCAFVAARGSAEPWLGGTLPAPSILILPTILFFATIVLAIGPTVRRIIRLTDAVRRSAASGYVAPVPVSGNDEITALAGAFQTAATQARLRIEEREHRERALREFLANTTHDVMIPLTVLQGHLSKLARLDPDRLDDGRRSTVISAMGEAHYIGALLRNLAAFARLDDLEPQLERCEVDLAALVERVVGRQRPLAKQLGVALEGATPEHSLDIDADITLVEQAVDNLVYNAIRHNSTGGHVAVILDGEPADRDAPGRFAIRVLDDGPGMTDDEIEAALQRGQRGNEARTRSPSGQGLGLDIVQQVATLHGFQFRLARSNGSGLEAVLAGPIPPGKTDSA